MARRKIKTNAAEYKEMRNGERNGSAVKVEGAGAANDVSREQLMGDRPADAASPPPGELCRIAIVTRDPLSFLLVFFLTLTRALTLLIMSELSRVRANRRVRVALIPCPRFPPALLRAH